MTGAGWGAARAATAWVCAAAVVGALAWAIVSRVGDGLAVAPARPPSTPVVLPTPDRTSPGGREATGTEGPHADPDHRGSRAPGGPSRGATPPGTAEEPPATDRTPSPSATTTAAGTDEGQPSRRSWRGEGGVVTTECSGARIRLVAAQPDSGYRVEVDDRGPDRVRVELERNDGEREVRVEATCASGQPDYRVSAR